MRGMRRLSMAMAIAVGLAGGLAIGQPAQADTLTIGAAYSLKPGAPIQHNRGHTGQRLHVVDQSWLAKEALLCGEGGL